MRVETKLSFAGFLYFFTLITGLWVSNLAGSARTAAFTVHVILAVSAAAFIIWSLFNLLKKTGLRSASLLLATLPLLCLVALISSGILLSQGLALGWANAVHGTMAIATIAVTAVSIYLLYRKSSH